MTKAALSKTTLTQSYQTPSRLDTVSNDDPKASVGLFESVSPVATLPQGSTPADSDRGRASGYSDASVGYCSRSTRFKIFPLGFLGIISVNSTAFGCLKRASLSWQKASISSAVSVGSVLTTTASGDSPHRTLFCPMTPASLMPGWL